MKKTFVLLLVLSMLLTFAACDKNEEAAITGASAVTATGKTEATDAPTDGAPSSTPGAAGSTTGGDAATETNPPATAVPPTTELPTTELSTTKPPTVTPSTTVSPITSSSPVTDADDYGKITECYSGRWYLAGYADVCIDVSRNDRVNISEMHIRAHNFSLPYRGRSDSFLAAQLMEGYILYPGKNYYDDKYFYDAYPGLYYTDDYYADEYDVSERSYHTGWEYLIEVPFDNNWNKSLAENEVVLGEGCIVIGNYTFIREKGSKDRYFGTPYRAAQGVWYVDKEPYVYIKIYTSVSAGDIDNTDFFSIEFADENGSSKVFAGRADTKKNWERFGISVENGALVRTLKDGTVRYYYREKASTKVTGIAVDVTELSLVEGETAQVTATVLPADATNKEFYWFSNNKNVAKVSASGKVTAIGKGTAILTVFSDEGDYTATCTVTVTEAPIIEQQLIVKGSIGVEQIISSSGSSSSFVRCVSVEAKASGGSGSYAEYYIKVYYNGKLVAEEAKDKIYVTLANGTYTAEVYVKDSNGKEATGTSSMKISGY